MTTDELKYKSIMGMRSKGVTAIKIEMEAQLDRPESSEYCNYCDEGTQRCDYCDSDGEVSCSDCDGSGVDNTTPDDQCENCEGQGYVTCSDCDGDREWDCNECGGDWRGSDGDFGNEDYCMNFIMDEVATLTGTPRNPEAGEGYIQQKPFSWMSYAKFYNDGSVDSECTLTIPLTDDLDINHIPKVLEAFRNFGESVGNGIDIDGAGMHIALLFDSECRYPCRNGVSDKKLNNFRKSMTQLLPALYFLGTSNGTTRGMEYRRPMVGHDTHRAAIDYRNGALEYRLFDTCYDKPEAILDNFVVMANSLKYLSDTYKDPNVHKICNSLEFGNDSSYELDRFYHSATHIDVLNAGLTLLKPSYYTLRQLKEQRGFKLNKRSFTAIERKYQADAEAAYAEYADRFEWSLTYKAERLKADMLIDFAQHQSIDTVRKTKPEDKIKEIEPTIQQRIKDLKAEMEKKEDFVRSRVNSLKRSLKGDYTLNFTDGESLEIY